MSNTRVDLGTVSVELPSSNWFDVTDDLPPGSPLTLGRGSNAVGALQLSIARYKSGIIPRLDLNQLELLLRDFFKNKELSKPEITSSRNESVISVQGEATSEDAFFCVWYISDGHNIALVTYTVLKEQINNKWLEEETAEARRIVASVRF